MTDFLTLLQQAVENIDPLHISLLFNMVVQLF